MRIGALAAVAKFGSMILLAQGVAAQVVPAFCVGIGDVVQVSVFESAAAGVTPGNFVTLPSQTVDHMGTISVPFAGQIKAAGRSIADIERDIETKLASRAIEPRILVTLIEQKATGHCLQL